MSDSSQRGRMGLCLAGGGITGAMFEVGCLAAIEESVEGFRASDFDVYVGAASGATIATALAGGLPALRLYRALLDPADIFFPLKRNHLMRFDFDEWRRVFATALSAARRFAQSVSSRPLETDVWNELDRFWDSLPAGAFGLDAYDAFLADFMARRGIPDRFDAMPKTLRIVAYDLDTGERVLFGDSEHAHVPVSRAACASSAIPILFAPVRIDGRDYVDGGLGDLAHADVADALGCDFVLVVNPVVAVHVSPHSRAVPTGHGKMPRVRDKGLLWVYHQSSRIRLHERFAAGLDRFRAERSGTELVLLEPDGSDATMFMHSPMNFAARREILALGYKSTIAMLRDDASPLRRALVRRGLTPRA